MRLPAKTEASPWGEAVAHKDRRRIAHCTACAVCDLMRGKASPWGEAPAERVMRGFIHACAAGMISRERS